MRTHKQNWLDIFAGFRTTLDAQKILLGMCGVYVTAIVLLFMVWVASWWWPDMFTGLQWSYSFESSRQVTMAIAGKLATAMAHPLAHDAADGGFRALALGVVGGMLLLAVWSLFGGAIARIAAVDFARGERLSIGEAFGFALKKFGSFFWSPMAPLIFILILLCCNALLGLLGRIPGVGPVIVGLFFFLTVLSSFLILLLAIEVIFGFMFMWPTIAMEGTYAFDAISRSFNYLFTRPWKTLWCCLVTVIYGFVCVGFVACFAWLMLKIAIGSMAVGLGAEYADIIKYLWRWGLSTEIGKPALAAILLLRVIVVIIGASVLAFIASFKISGMTIIYTILRRDVDGSDMSEVFLPEPEDESSEPESDPRTGAADEPES